MVVVMFLADWFVYLMEGEPLIGSTGATENVFTWCLEWVIVIGWGVGGDFLPC